MIRPRTPALVAALVAAAALAGCGIGDPYETGAGDRASTAYPGAATTPEATLRHAALLDGNWTSATAPDSYRRLAALSTGGAREDFEEIAYGSRTDVQQTTAGTDSKATVTAVVVRDSGPIRRGVVVTRQWFTKGKPAHLPPEYKVTLATVELRGDRWVITTWRPQQ